ncbi:hypothetical protein SADUNF_Sadunf09G0093200 [Salix dunnii]|uniref:Uncharacterized protein n=1 Tax=Salix dunnii TaxID=1413687 RepID=A0A835JY02_9ROSI|nr:hypothetical protein SADUNF_Sadunf09G0093200 [Salix dunnii]
MKQQYYSYLKPSMVIYVWQTIYRIPAIAISERRIASPYSTALICGGEHHQENSFPLREAVLEIVEFAALFWWAGLADGSRCQP